MGCKERSRGALGIPGERPAGVFTAGTAQAYMNLYNRMPGKEVVILGSGDIGMIMARRMTLEGAHVQAVFELMPYPSGLPRNIVQCLDDYNIPLYLSHTVTEIHGRDRLTGVTISEVDANRRPIPGTEKEYKCDTLILSVGLIPENKLLEDAASPLTPTPTVPSWTRTCRPTCPACSLPAMCCMCMIWWTLFPWSPRHWHATLPPTLRARASTLHAGREVRRGRGPHHSAEGQRQERLSLSLRVRNHYRDCRIVVRQNGVEVAAKKMKKAILRR